LRKKCIFLLVLILVANNIYAQKPLQAVAQFKNIASAAFKNIEVSSYCYTTSNTLYVGTNNGLYTLKFGKISAIHFPFGTNKIITSIIQDGANLLLGTNEGILIFNTYTQTVLKLTIKGRLQQVINNYCLLLNIDKNKNIVFYTGYDTSAYYSYNLKTRITSFIFNKSDAFRAYKNDELGNLQKMWVVESTGMAYYKFKNLSLIQKKSFFYGGVTGTALSITEIVNTNNVIWCSTNKGLLYFNTENNSWKLIPCKKNTAFYSLVAYNQKIICSSSDGLDIYDTLSKKWLPTILHKPDNEYSLASNTIKKIGVINSNVLLVITNNGISFLPLDETKQFVYSLPSQKINEPVFITHTGKQGIAATKSNLYLLNNKIEIVYSTALTYKSIIKQAIPILKNGWACITNDACFLIDSNGNKTNVTTEPGKPFHFNFIVPSKNINELLVGGAEGLFELNLSKLILNKIAIDSSILFYYYQYGFSDENIFYVNANYSYLDIFTKKDSLKYHYLGKIQTKFNVYDCVKVATDKFLLACNNGLKLLDINTHKIIEKYPTFENTIYKILVYHTDTILCTNDGLWQYTNNLIVPYLHPLSTLITAGPSTNYSKVNSDLLFNSEDKIYKIPISKNEIINGIEATLNVFLNEQEVDTTKIVFGKSVQFKLNDNNFFPLIHPIIEYNINNTIDWINCTNQFFSIDRLPIGENTITIKGTVAGTILYKKKFIIYVLPIWYQTNWFKWGIACLVFICIGFCFIAVMKYQKKKANKKLLLQKQLSSFENKALRSQMNPHFIFNTMNSINSAVISKETDTASEYIHQFSKLMRLTLENSQHDYISLYKELEALKIYLKLEQFRLDKTFSFKINTDNNIDVHDCLIPPLILQPYAENSIWHGLIHKQMNGKIFIDITTSNYCFIITITDNGIGRLAASNNHNSNEKNKSLGTNITLQRIKMMNSNNTVCITDLLNANNTITGTKVTLTFYQSNE
jgi:Histidine kinase